MLYGCSVIYTKIGLPHVFAEVKDQTFKKSGGNNYIKSNCLLDLSKNGLKGVSSKQDSEDSEGAVEFISST